MVFFSIFKDIGAFLFPRYCLGCGQIISHQEQFLCVACRHELRQTNFHLLSQERNPMIRKFWGRVVVQKAAALLYYEKGAVSQRLIHALKYHDRQQVGLWLGQWYATELAQTGYFAGVDLVLPVPLHPKKKKKRGYNQVTLFGETLAQALQVPYREDILLKQTYNSAQAKKHWLERQKTTAETFVLTSSEQIAGKHILIIDDIVTTGATLAQCAALLIATGAKVSFACMAYSNNE